ncbi:hypothetical protein OAO87_02825 [bacterium]|nr:hypothetical protein [bacterium]
MGIDVPGRFFGLRRGDSNTDLVKQSANYLYAQSRSSRHEQEGPGASVEWDLRRCALAASLTAHRP